MMDVAILLHVRNGLGPPHTQSFAEAAAVDPLDGPEAHSGQLYVRQNLTSHSTQAKLQLAACREPQKAHIPPEIAPPVLEPRPLVRFSWPPRELSCEALGLLIKPGSRNTTSPSKARGSFSEYAVSLLNG
jgi:hypothetical protein